ncbi:MAG: nitrous oxide reductase accessory protein NosL [Roseiarcus sp.]
MTEHAGPKGQIFIRGLPDPYWFSSVRDAFAFTMLQETPKAISAFYVSDMARAKNWDQPEPGMWVEAREAYFVIGSRRRGGMGADEAIPFSVAAAARGFADANGGRVVRFAEMPKDYVLATSSGDP